MLPSAVLLIILGIGMQLLVLTSSGNLAVERPLLVETLVEMSTFRFGSGYIYVTVTFFKSRVSSFFNVFRVAKNFINFIINP